jgi:hypothetical protein
VTVEKVGVACFIHEVVTHFSRDWFVGFLVHPVSYFTPLLLASALAKALKVTLEEVIAREAE